jgi:nicotinamide-nucleotide amidase
MSHSRSSSLVAIGDELLNGLRGNGHLVYLGEQLDGLGLPLIHSVEVTDERQAIAEAVKGALKRSHLVITTGGLGPTEDDYTVEAVAQALGRKLVYHAPSEARIRSFFESFNRQPTENNFKQCQVIEGAEVLPNDNGTAPAQWINVDEEHVLVLLPGPPRELQPLFTEAVIPHLHELGWASPEVPTITLRTVGIGESKVATLLEPLLAEQREDFRVAYCAHLPYVDIRLTSGPAFPESQLRALAERCREALGTGFIGYGTPTLPCLIINELRALSKTLAVAESCTGGLLASHFTDVVGASKVFNGGVVCYRNAIKQNLLGVPQEILQQHGAVSAECAIAMATGVAELMEADYALSITGYAGPEGGTEPAGTVYLGYYSPVGVWSRRVALPGNRSDVKERAVAYALDFIRRKLDKYKMYDLLESLRC